MYQMKEKDKNPEKQLNEVEISNLQEKEWVSQCNCKQGFQAECDLENSCIMEGLDPSGGAVEC